MNKDQRLFTISIFLLGILLVTYALQLLPLLVIIILILIQKTVLDLLMFPAYLGVDISFFALILVAMIYGPAVGFVFGLIIIPFFGILRLLLNLPILEGLSYLVPSVASLIVGLIGVLAGFMTGYFSFLTIVIVTIVLKNIALVLQTWITENLLVINPTYALNIIVTIVIAFLLEQNGIISLVMAL